MLFFLELKGSLKKILGGKIIIKFAQDNTVPEMFCFPIFRALTVLSQCVHLRSLLCSIRANRLQSAHCAFTKCSPCGLRSLFLQCSLIVQSGNIIFKRITIHTSWGFFYFFMITNKTQCKDNFQGTPNKYFILCSQSVHLSFTIHFAFCLRSAFAQSALTIQVGK